MTVQTFSIPHLARVCFWVGMFSLTGIASAQEELTSQWAMTNSALSVDKSASRQTMQMVVNTSREVTADQIFKRVRIQNPAVLNAIPLEGGNRLQISAVATGITQIDLLGAGRFCPYH